MEYLGLVNFFGKVFEVFKIIDHETYIYRLLNTNKTYLIDLEV